MDGKTILTENPVVLGKGIPLFPKQPKVFRWKLDSCKATNSGILAVDYVKTSDLFPGEEQLKIYKREYLVYSD